MNTRRITGHLKPPCYTRLGRRKAAPFNFIVMSKIMKKLVISTLVLFFLASAVNAEPKLKWFLANGNIFSVQAPSSWIKNKKSEYLSISSPNGNVSITASA